MTFKVVFAVATKTISVPASAPAAGTYRARILNANGEVVQQALHDTVDFPAFTTIPAGAYTGEVSRLDATGAVIDGSVVSAPFDTGAEQPVPVSVDVPSTLSFTVTQE